MPTLPARSRFLDLLRTALADGTLIKLTLGKYRGSDPTLRNLFVRPVALKSGPALAFLWRHATRDVAKNYAPSDAGALLEPLIGGEFLDAHLFTPAQTAQLECTPGGKDRLRVVTARTAPAAASEAHDRSKVRLISPDAPWLQALGVTNEQGRPREGQAAKFRQINKFVELLTPLMGEAFPWWTDTAHEPLDLPQAGTPSAEAGAPRPLRVVDMGSGKGYLTFALASLLGPRAAVRGIEVRPELVDFCNDVASRHGFAPHLTFSTGTIADTPVAEADVLIALHACDTATDDAIAKGVSAGAALIVVAPCCQKELRPQLVAPAVLAGALRHGIFQERQAEFVTDSLRAELLEWAGYRTRVLEFISTEHTPKNLMIAAVKKRPLGDDTTAGSIRELAAFYGIRTQRLATHLGVNLLP